MRAAKTPAERMREKRARDKLADEERLTRLLAKTIKLQLFHSTSETLNARAETKNLFVIR